MADHPIEALPHVEALPVPEADQNSAYDEDVESTSSITSSVYAYEVEHGRSYHAYKAGKYVLPNDEEEQERMDIQYHSLRILFDDKPILAPIGEKPQNILDVGTGTGIWCMDVGEMYPSAKVIGTDLSPIQPPFVPPNVQFEINDCNDFPWSFKPNIFDLIHTRIMSGFGIRDWTEFYKEAIKSIKPGGWMESQEFDLGLRSDDNTIPANSAVQTWCDNMVSGALIVGMKLRLESSELSEAMRAAGFTNIVVKEYKMPIGLWPADPRLREAGKFQLGAMLYGLYGMSVAIFTRFLKMEIAEMEILLARVRAEWKLKRVHTYYMMYCVYGQKPPEEASTETAHEVLSTAPVGTSAAIAPEAVPAPSETAHGAGPSLHGKPASAPPA